MIRWGAIFGLGSRDDEEGGIAGLLIAGILAPIAATLIQLAISRTREYQADASGAQLTHNPLYLASALRKLEAANERMPLDASPATAHHVYRESAERGGNLAAVLDPSADRGANPSARADARRDRSRKVDGWHRWKNQEDKRGFKVQDRRRFSAEGEAKAGGDNETPSREQRGARHKIQTSRVRRRAASKPQAGRRAARGEPAQSSEPPPELTFAAFLWSLSEQALAALGEIPDPASGQVTHDLMLAQQMIDIIIMLRDKTRGNLDAHEQAMLKEILSGLQMKYVELARQPGR